MENIYNKLEFTDIKKLRPDNLASGKNNLGPKPIKDLSHKLAGIHKFFRPRNFLEFGIMEPVKRLKKLFNKKNK